MPADAGSYAAPAEAGPAARPIRPDPSVKSAVRVFEILEAFREAQRPLRLRDLVERLGYPASSLAGLLKTMAGAGYLGVEPGARSYYPTPLLARLGSWIPAVAFESGPVLAAMRRLQHGTGELIVLGTVNDLHVEYVEALRATQGIQLWTPPGTRLPIINLGMGWLFLSRLLRPGEMPERSRHLVRLYQRTVDRGLLRQTDFPFTALAERVAAARMRDWLFTSAASYCPHLHPGHPGGGMVSMLVPSPPGHRALAIGVGGPAERLERNLERIGAELQREMKGLAEITD